MYKIYKFVVLLTLISVYNLTCSSGAGAFVGSLGSGLVKPLLVDAGKDIHTFFTEDIDL